MFIKNLAFAISLLAVTGACATAAKKLPDVNPQTAMMLEMAKFCTQQGEQASQDTCIKAMRVVSDTAIETTKPIAEAAKPQPAYSPYGYGSDRYNPYSTSVRWCSHCTVIPEKYPAPPRR